MADFAEWGGGGGLSSAINDQGQIARTGLVNAQADMQRAELQDLPQVRRKREADIVNTLATAGMHTVDTALKQEALTRSKAMAQKMQELSQNPTAGTDPTDMMIDMASGMVKAAVSVGAVNDAQHWASSLNQLVGHKNTALKNVAEAKRAERMERIADYDEVSRQVGIIENLPLDQQVPAYNEMNRYFSKKRNEPVPWGNMQWSPQTAQVLKDASMSQKEKEAAEFRTDRQQWLEKERDASRLLKKTEDEVRQVTREREQDRKDAAAKIAGLKAEGPNKQDIQAATLLVKKEFPDIDKEDLVSVAEDIATEARALRLKNPGLSPSDARGKALLDVKGQLETSGINVLGVDIPGTKTTRYGKNSLGGSPATALPLPTDQADFKQDRYYTNPQGVVAQWKKKPDGTFGLKKVSQ